MCGVVCGVSACMVCTLGYSEGKDRQQGGGHHSLYFQPSHDKRTGAWWAFTGVLKKHFVCISLPYFFILLLFCILFICPFSHLVTSLSSLSPPSLLSLLPLPTLPSTTPPTPPSPPSPHPPFYYSFLHQTLHQLTARAIIRDWTEGSLDVDKTQHEVGIIWTVLEDIIILSSFRLSRESARIT